MFADDEYEIPKYDLIIIDEIESILSHFDAPTFKGTSRDVFNWMSEIIKNSNKMIVLDGDIKNRTHNFLNYFGNSINIHNTIKINKKKLTITTDTNKYYNSIIDDIKQALFIKIRGRPGRPVFSRWNKFSSFKFPADYTHNLEQ